MIFDEIQKAVAQRREIPENATLQEWYCYLSLVHLMDSFQRGTISQADAGRVKLDLMHAFRDAVLEDRRSTAMYIQYQHNIRRAEEYVNQLCQGKNAGQDADVLLPVAIRCIAALTADSGILNHFNLEAGQ